MAELITADGFSLRQPWCDVEDLSPLVVTPGYRTENVVVPARHGVVRTPNKRYGDARPALPMRVLGVDPTTGLLVADGVTQLHENLDRLLKVFHSGAVLLEHTRPDGSARQANVELTTDPTVATRERSLPPMSRVQFDLTLWDAFWSDADAVSQTITGITGTVQALTAFADATAPMSELTVTFIGPINNPQINFGDGFVKYNGTISSGQRLVVDTGTWQVSPGTGTIWSPDPRQIEFAPGPRWLELDPTVTPFEAQLFHTGGGTATATIEGRRRYLSP
jgi:hypothetical protein